MENRYIIINKNAITTIEKNLNNAIIKRIYDLNNLPCIKCDSSIIKNIDININKCNEMQVIEAEYMNNIILYNHNIIKKDSVILKDNYDSYIMLEFDNNNLIIHIYTKNIKYVINKSEIKAELINKECILVSDNKSFILLSNFLTF